MSEVKLDQEVQDILRREGVNATCWLDESYGRPRGVAIKVGHRQTALVWHNKEQPPVDEIVRQLIEWASK